MARIFLLARPVQHRERSLDAFVRAVGREGRPVDLVQVDALDLEAAQAGVDLPC